MSSPPQFLSSLTKAILRGKHTNIHYSPVRAVPSSGQWPCQWPGGLGGLRCPRPAHLTPRGQSRPRGLAASRLRGSAGPRRRRQSFHQNPHFLDSFLPLLFWPKIIHGARGAYFCLLSGLRQPAVAALTAAPPGSARRRFCFQGDPPRPAPCTATPRTATPRAPPQGMARAASSILIRGPRVRVTFGCISKH